MLNRNALSLAEHDERLDDARIGVICEEDACRISTLHSFGYPSPDWRFSVHPVSLLSLSCITKIVRLNQALL